MSFTITTTFTTDDEGIAFALANLIKDIAPWMVDNVRVDTTEDDQ